MLQDEDLPSDVQYSTVQYSADPRQCSTVQYSTVLTPASVQREVVLSEAVIDQDAGAGDGGEN